MMKPKFSPATKVFIAGRYKPTKRNKAAQEKISSFKYKI